MKNRIKLTESELHRIVVEAIENELDEGWFGDKWNQTKSAFSTVFDTDDNSSNKKSRQNKAQNKEKMSIGQRFKGAVKNWNTQGEINQLRNFSETCSKAIKDFKLDPNLTLQQIAGGQFGSSINNRIGNRVAQIRNRGGNSY